MNVIIQHRIIVFISINHKEQEKDSGTINSPRYLHEGEKMQTILELGGIGIEIRSKDSFGIRGVLNNYISQSVPQIRLQIVKNDQIAKMTIPYIGEDMFCRYYRDQTTLIAEAKGKQGIPSARICCKEHMKKICFESYPQMHNQQKYINGVFKLLPIYQILHEFHAFLLHSSRIQLEEKAILFTGASGIGKSTQAALWKKYEQTKQLCNDRTIVRYEQEKWNTYGYFEDGSEPIAENKCLPLGAIVCLKQGNENRIRKINGVAALRYLMSQIFIDHWDVEMTNQTANRVLDLLSMVPVYLLECTADQRAVNCLKEKLKEEGVIK